MKYHIVTFGCQANEADSERIAALYEARGYTHAENEKDADDIIINTCMIRESAENRVYGIVRNLREEKKKGREVKIIVTGCMVGMAARDKTGKLLKAITKRLPGVDEFLPIEEVGFDYAPVRGATKYAYVPITNGCNNFCTYCVVPFSRGREVSRPFADIVEECRQLVSEGRTRIMLLGQNVNSYGADLLLGPESVQAMRDIPDKAYFKKETTTAGETVSFTYEGKTHKPVYVKHLGRLRIPTLFPILLEEVAKIEGIEEVEFISSNPWDFSDELIDVIVRYPVITRHIHLPVQAGDNTVLRRMNRWYTREEYLALVAKMKDRIPGVTFSTDIIVGFCGETAEQFENSVDLAKKVGFTKAYVAIYSDRPMTAAHKSLVDDVPFEEKKRRWEILEELINRTNLKNGTYR